METDRYQMDIETVLGRETWRRVLISFLVDLTVFFCLFGGLVQGLAQEWTDYSGNGGSNLSDWMFKSFMALISPDDEQHESQELT